LPFSVSGCSCSAVIACRVSELADHDLVGARAALEALRGVHRVAGDESVAAARIAHDRLARVDPDTHVDPNAERKLELLVEGGERIAHLDCRPDGAQGVVLVQDRSTEDGHDRVADELPDRASDPTTSQNTTVTVLRTSRDGMASESRRAPQDQQ
jgi:hypothetical protein